MENSLIIGVSLEDIIKRKKSEILRKNTRQIAYAFHILLDGKLYKTFSSSSHRREHLNTNKFKKLAQGHKVSLLYQKQIYYNNIPLFYKTDGS